MIDKARFIDLGKLIGVLLVAFIVVGGLTQMLLEDSFQEQLRSEYRKGYNDALKRQEFKLGSIADTIFVYHDGARFSILAASDSIILDFIWSDSTRN